MQGKKCKNKQIITVLCFVFIYPMRYLDFSASSNPAASTGELMSRTERLREQA